MTYHMTQPVVFEGGSLLARWLGSCALCLAACSADGQPHQVGAAAPVLAVTADAPNASASATLRDARGAIVGVVWFKAEGETTFVQTSADLPASGTSHVRGIHIHANDAPENGEGCIADPAEPPSTHFVSADGHYNPDGTTHGSHAGDMPALFIAHNGEAYATFQTDRFRVEDVLGRAAILHEDSDNYGNIPVGDAPEQYRPNSPAATDLTARTGNAGARFACGVIE